MCLAGRVCDNGGGVRVVCGRQENGLRAGDASPLLVCDQKGDDSAGWYVTVALTRCNTAIEQEKTTLPVAGFNVAGKAFR